ncbi:MAG: ABC transporter permease [Desulfobacterales bacterium]|nr:ABC transporter permease [Desulfobacterales bacterium]
MWNWIKEMSLAARIGLFIVLLNLGVALLAPVVAPHGETAVVGDVWEPFSQSFLLGTDHLGRDLFSRMVYGARNTIALAFIITSLSFLAGSFLGFTAAVKGGWTDQLLSRMIDVIMALPTLIFALMILSVLGSSVPVLIFTIALLDSTRVFRLSRAVAMDIEVKEFVEAARLRGEGSLWIMRHEILPNALSPLVAEFGLRFCFVFLFIASLSFLGLGIQPPHADWGGMVRENAGAITFGIFIPLIPAFAIAFLTVGVNLVVDHFLHLSSGLRD